MICGQAIQGRMHICAFVDSREEQYDILLPFLRQGIDESDLIVSIVDQEHIEDHRCRCGKEGIHLAAEESSGRVRTLGFENTYLIDRHFSADRMLELLDRVLQDARAKGFPRVRAFGEMHWALRDLPGTEELIEYESRLNDVCEKYPDPVICIYDVTKFPGRVLMDILATHPKVILGGRIVENPYYTPPKEFLASYRRRRAQMAGIAMPSIRPA